MARPRPGARETEWRTPPGALKTEWRTPPGALRPRAWARWPDWICAGDVNGFLGLALDNITQLIILSSLLIGVFKFPPDIVLTRMVPGRRWACWSEISCTQSSRCG